MRVLLDTDPGLGRTFADVDDGLTLFLLLNNPKFEIEGITTVFGNTKVKTGYPLMKKYLKLAGRADIPHKMGASSKRDLGKLNAASRLLIEKVREHPKELTLLTLGPLTNIATALRHYPEFFNDLKKIVMMGGTLTPFAGFLMNRLFFDKMRYFVSEFNFNQDAEATKEVIEFKTMTPRVEMGLDICCRTVFKKEHLRRIEAVQKPIPQFIAKHIKFWLNLWKIFLKGGFYPFDTFVPIYLLKPELFKVANLYLEVDTENIPAKLSILKAKRENSAPITYCLDFVDSKAKEEFMDILISNLIQ